MEGLGNNMIFHILDYPFQSVCEIIPESDSDGMPKEYMPQFRYRNISNIPLNKYGQGPFCQFKIPSDYYGKSGVYVISVNSLPKYVGKCENLGIRWNMGYGHIAPRNCYRRGRETNCRINNLILETFKRGDKIVLLFYETNDKHRIESYIIEKLRPEWNISISKTSRIDRKLTPMRNLVPYHLLRNSRKYSTLQEYLRNSQNRVEILTYNRIESILGTKLPASAYKHRAWWANKGHPHAWTWISVGWKVKAVNLGKSVTFEKNIKK